MRIFRIAGPTVLAALSAALLTVPSAVAAPAVAWSSSSPQASWSNGGYTVYNDVWGAGAGSQTISANSGTNWWISTDQPNTGGVKSYPNSTRNVNKSLSSLHSVNSSVSFSTPSNGVWDAAYDIWDTSNANEIMLWFNERVASPIGSKVTTVSVGGSTWNVYRGSNGHQVYSFVRTSGENSGSVDVLAVLKWIESQGWFGNITLGAVQFGFEVTTTSGTQTFTVNSYSVSSS